jgi:hypothetical protein
MPSDTDVGKRVLVVVEEREIGVETDAAVEEFEGNPAGAKARTCYIGRNANSERWKKNPRLLGFRCRTFRIVTLLFLGIRKA